MRSPSVLISHVFPAKLDEYQEQSYLLDPFLEQLVVPVVDCLKRHVSASLSATHIGSVHRIGHLSALLYQYVKCRGYKTISKSPVLHVTHQTHRDDLVRFFPHEVADMSILLEYMKKPDGPYQTMPRWSLRYVILLWLSLVCMIPFDLEQFDEPNQAGGTAESVESLAKQGLGNAGLEREGSAIVLSRFYMR